MPQPNMQQMLKQAQKMQQDMLAAQEALKDEVVAASAGGGMVTVKVTGDLVVKSITIDPEAVDPDDVELLQDMVLAAINEGSARPRSSPQRSSAGSPAGWRRRPGRPRPPWSRPLADRDRSVYAPPVQRLITELSKLPGVGGRTAQRLTFHLLRASDEEALALADAITRGQGADRPLRDVLQPRRRPALPDLRRRAPRPRGHLRRRRALGRDLDRAHARVQRSLPRARGSAVADRRDRPRGPQDRRAVRACGERPGPRGRHRHEPDDHRRGDRDARRGRDTGASPRNCRDPARRGLPVGPTSSTPTS